MNEIERQKAFDAKLNRFFSRVGLTIVSVLIFFLLAECSFRTYDKVATDTPFWGADEYNELYTDHPFLYKVPRANASFTIYHINRHGFRGRDFEVPKPEGVFRILTVGGSAAWDSNVSGTDATWAAQLEDKLNATRTASEPRFEVVNGGIPGYNSAESFMNFVWRGLPIEPDAVIVYQGYNDFKPNRHPDFKADYSHFRKIDHSALRSMSRRWRTLLYLGKFLQMFKGYDGTAHDTVAQPGLDAFQLNLRRIALLAKDRGVQPVFATYGMSTTDANFQAHPDKFKSLEKYLPTLTQSGILDAHKRYNEAVLAEGRAQGVPVADIAATVPQDFEHYKDHCHFVDKGSTLAAEHFATVIRTQLNIPGLPNQTALVSP